VSVTLRRLAATDRCRVCAACGWRVRRGGAAQYGQFWRGVRCCLLV